jgi:Ser/Thr protein kinase RdoA (MazF antagonist)
MRWRFTTSHARRLGAAAAALHRHAATFRAPPGTWAKEWDARVACAIDRSSEVVAVAGARAAPVYAAVHDRLRKAAQTIDEARVLVNGDLGPHNAVWRTDGDGRPGLFDFNDLALAWAGWDLARTVRTVRWRANGEALVGATLDGYRSIAPVPRSFVEHGALFELAANVFLAAYLAPKVPERGPETAATVRRLIDEASAADALLDR